MIRFLFKSIIALGAVVLLVPVDPPAQGAGEPTGHFDTFTAMKALSGVMTDVSSFCERQPETCSMGGELWTQFGGKAVLVAKEAYEALHEHFGTPQQTASSTPQNDTKLGKGQPQQPSSMTLRGSLDSQAPAYDKTQTVPLRSSKAE
jgi:Family of unknown function (DUF5330)